MTTTSYDNNFMFPLVGKEWCSIKCENDLDYIEPFVDRDTIYFQHKLPIGQFIGYIAIVNWNNTVVVPPFSALSFSEFYDAQNVIVGQILTTGLCSGAASEANKCFKIALNVYSAPYGSGSVLYTTRSVKYSCTFCEQTVIISSTYNDKDCLGNYYNMDTIPKEGGQFDLALAPYYSNAKRIYASLKKLPSKVNLSSNSNCYLYKSEIIEAYELQGTKLYPPYVARQIENIMLGRNLRINGEEFQLRGDSIFEPLKVEGMSMFRLKAQLEKCPCEVVFDCGY